jgi:hypothetical protein
MAEIYGIEDNTELVWITATTALVSAYNESTSWIDRMGARAKVAGQIVTTRPVGSLAINRIVLVESIDEGDRRQDPHHIRHWLELTPEGPEKYQYSCQYFVQHLRDELFEYGPEAPSTFNRLAKIAMAIRLGTETPR